jgi:hypothetical protein
MAPIRVVVESTPKKVFASALDWPGLSRGGRDERDAIRALLAALPRYAAVAEAAGLLFAAPGADVEIDVIERVPGNASTAFGVPAVIIEADRRATDEGEAALLAALVDAAWVVFDRVAAAAPEELRKGPRGGGRDRTKIVGHVNEADRAYAGQIGIRIAPGTVVAALRAAILDALRVPSDGSPLASRKWTQRYAARRIAWHALDHAWEIEERTEPG